MSTNIQVSTLVWRELKDRRRSPSDSFDDVLRRELDLELEGEREVGT